MPTMTRKCANCGEVFTRYIKPSILTKGGSIYCSLTCSGEASRVRRIDRTCESCGTVFQFRDSNSRSDRGKFCSVSCSAKVNSTRHGHTIHDAASPTYRTWCAMIQRCENQKHSKYHRYGAVGINVCDEWHDFHTFLADMGERPHGTTIDRIDGSLGYSKGNCRWASPKEQQRNLRNNVWIEFNGKKMIASDICKEIGISFMTLKYRMRNWPESEWYRKTERGRPLSKRI